MGDVRKLIPNVPLEPSSAPTLYERLWFKLDGAYERYKKLERATKRGTPGLSPELAKARCVGLVEAIAIMSTGVLDEDEVRAKCVSRFRARQPKTPRSD